jgi:hypothetical protein
MYQASDEVHAVVHIILGVIYVSLAIVALFFYSRLRLSIPSHTKKLQFNFIKSRRLYIWLFEILALGKSKF